MFCFLNVYSQYDGYEKHKNYALYQPKDECVRTYPVTLYSAVILAPSKLMGPKLCSRPPLGLPQVPKVCIKPTLHLRNAWGVGRDDRSFAACLMSISNIMAMRSADTMPKNE